MNCEYNKTLSFKEALYNCYTNRSFEGRARRSEFWWSTLFWTISSNILVLAMSFLAGCNIINRFIILLYFIFLILYIIVGYFQLAVTVRRLHDTGHSGWWVGTLFLITILCTVVRVLYGNIEFLVWLHLTNYILFFVIIIGFCSRDSLKATNEYGKSPKYDLTYCGNENNKDEGIHKMIMSGCTGCVGCFLFPLIIIIAIGCFFSGLVCDIDPTKTYSWYHGIWHGLFFILNFIRSLFGDAIFKAEYYTTGYSFCWWVTVIFEVLGLLKGIFKS